MPGKRITKKESNSLYRLLKFMHDTLVANDITYWIVGGTLLGAIRHQGLIPWDDDADICILKKDAKKFAKLRPVFEKAGYEVDDEPDEDNKICRKNNSCSYAITSKGLDCDVFIMEQKGNKITYADPYWANEGNGGKRCYFLKDHVFPLIPLRFGNFFLYAPNNAIVHLNTCYGKDWNSMSMMLYNHRTGRWGSGRKHQMKPEEYAAPAPPKDTCDGNLPIINACKYRKK